MASSRSVGTRRKVIALTLTAVLVSSSIAAVVTVSIGVASAANTSTIEGTPHLSASAPDAQFDPGESGTLAVTITNDATYEDNGETHPTEARNRAGEARSVSVNVSDTRAAPLTVETGTQSVGTIQDGESGGPYTFNVVVDEDAEAGNYTVNVTTEYRHAEEVTYEEVADGEYAYNESVVTRTETDTITVEIEPEARFSVTDRSHDVPLGGEGTIALAVTNTGDEDVTDSTVSVTSGDSDFYFGSGTATSEANVGEWNAGETKTLRFRAGTVDSAVAREYPIDVSVEYTDSDGTSRATTEQIGITPRNRTRFDVVDVTHDVPRDGEGTVTVTVDHTAGKTIEDVAVTASTTATDVYLGGESSRSSTTFVGSWGGEERTELTFRIGTTDDAVARSYPIELQFEYTDDDDNDNTRTSFVEFTPDERDQFDVSIAGHDVPQNGEGTLTLSITNTGETVASDVTVTTSSSDSTVSIGGSSSQSATTVVERWAAGERRNVTVRVGTTDSAVERPYPLDVTIEYTDDEHNDNSRTDSLEFVPHGRDVFRVDTVTHGVPQNGEGTLTVNVTHLMNKTVQDVTVTASTTATDVYLGSESSRSSTTSIGSWAPNQTQRLTFRVGTADAAVDRPYPIELQFEYTDAEDNDNTRTKQIEFTPESRDRFGVTIANHDVPQDGEGTMALALAHRGDRNISDVSVTVTSGDPAVYLGDESSRSSTSVVKDWTGGTDRTVTFRVGTTDSAVERAYPLDVTIEYTDDEHNDNSRSTVVELVPTRREHFEVGRTEHDIPVNGGGTIDILTRQITNETIEDVTVTASTTASDVYLGDESSRSSTTTIESWADRDAHEFTFRVGTTDAAVEQAYPIRLQFEYTDAEDNDNTRTKVVDFTPESRDRFETEIVDHDVPRGGEGMVTVELDRIADGDVSDVSVTATTGDSAVYLGTESSTSSTTTIDTVEERGVEEIQFRVGTTESAVDRPYPLELTLEYTDPENNDNQRTKTVEFVPQPTDHVSIEGLEHDVPRNGEGTVTVTVVNTAEKVLEDVSMTASSTDPEVYLGSEGSQSGTTVVSEWGPGVEKTVTYRVGTTESAVNRTYPLTLDFEYTDAEDNDNTQTETIEFRPGRREQFRVAAVSHDVPRNGEGTVTVAVEQLTGKPFEDVTVTASTTASDLYLGTESSRSSTSAVGSWPANTSQNLTFRVGTTDAAVNRTYPIDLEFQYTDADDNDNTRTKQITVAPRLRDAIAIRAVEDDVVRDGVGTVTIVADNTAGKNLSEVTVTASTTDSELYIGSASSRSGTATISEWNEADSRRLTFRVGATENAVDRPYPLDLQFEYTDAADNDNQLSREVAVRPRSEPQFVVESIDHAVPVGSSGRVTLTLRNDGPVNATEALLTASAQDDAMFFGTGGAEPIEVQGVSIEPPQTGTPTAQTYVGDWPVGETRTVAVRAGFDDDAIVREYVATLAIDYENENGDDMPDRTRAVGIEPLPEQRFVYERVESELFVGEEGDLSVEITNVGDRAVDGLVVTATTQDQNVNFYNTRYAVGTLEAGESVTARYRAGVTEEAEHGPRVFELSARYRDPGGDVRQSDSGDVIVDIGEDRDAFALETTDGTFAPGESGPFAITITNRRNETLSNVQANLFTDEPLDSDDDSAFVPELDPGESTTITLDLSVGSGASEKTYSASMDLRFDNARGESELSDTYRVPVVVEQTESSLGLTVILAALLGLIALAVVGWRLGAFERLRSLFGRSIDSVRSDGEASTEDTE